MNRPRRMGLGLFAVGIGAILTCLVLWRVNRRDALDEVAGLTPRADEPRVLSSLRRPEQNTPRRTTVGPDRKGTPSYIDTTSPGFWESAKVGASDLSLEEIDREPLLRHLKIPAFQQDSILLNSELVAAAELGDDATATVQAIVERTWRLLLEVEARHASLKTDNTDSQFIHVNPSVEENTEILRGCLSEIREAVPGPNGSVAATAIVKKLASFGFGREMEVAFVEKEGGKYAFHAKTFPDRVRTPGDVRSFQLQTSNPYVKFRFGHLFKKLVGNPEK